MSFDDFGPSEPVGAPNNEHNQLFKAGGSIWYEKYRPKTVDEVILPPYLKDKIKGYVDSKGYNMPHLGLFSRLPGTGKSSLAKAIVADLKAEALWINASMDKGIDVLRTKIHRFASHAPLKDSVKVVVMDEFDHFSRDGQTAFRGFIDQFGENVRFIFTGNYKENIEPALLDRMEIYDFNAFHKEDVVKLIFERLCFILNEESVTYDKKDVVEIIRTCYPRIRQMVGRLGSSIQESETGEKHLNIQLGSNIGDSKEDLAQLCHLIKTKDYEGMLKKVYALGVPDHWYSTLGTSLDSFVQPSQKLNAIIILAKYQVMSQQAKDRHLNLAGCISEIMKL